MDAPTRNQVVDRSRQHEGENDENRAGRLSSEDRPAPDCRRHQSGRSSQQHPSLVCFVDATLKIRQRKKHNEKPQADQVRDERFDGIVRQLSVTVAKPRGLDGRHKS